MTKDRLLEMKKIMSESDMNASEDELMGSDESSQLYNEFFEKIGELRLELQRIRNRIDIIKKFHAQIQSCINLEVRKEIEQKVEEECKSITMAAIKIRETLKKTVEAFSNDSTPAMRRIRDVQVNALLEMLKETMHTYLNCLTKHREKSVQMLQNMLAVKQDEDADVQDLLNEGKIALFVNNIKMETLQAKYDLREVEGRHQEILRIENSIMELKNLFNELAFYVSLQGEKINSIQAHMSGASVDVEKARKTTKKTLDKVKALRHRKVYLSSCCVVVVILVILLLIIFL